MLDILLGETSVGNKGNDNNNNIFVVLIYYLQIFQWVKKLLWSKAKGFNKMIVGRFWFCFCLQCYKTFIDINMTSPPSSPPLYGLSRTTGGTTHGQAVGNIFNLGDAGDDDQNSAVIRNDLIWLIQVMIMKTPQF